MAKSEPLYLGIDVGGTKIQAVLARPTGLILVRERVASPRDAEPKALVAAIADLARETIAEGPAGATIAAAGLAVPGVVDRGGGTVVVTPNMNLSGMPVVAMLEEALDVPVALGNDVNLGTLGETSLGAARGAASVIGLFPGTGIGGGVILDGRLVLGAHGAAGEIGHMKVVEDGPTCGCGARGCLEAVASRTAIERHIRDAVDNGRKTVLKDLVGKDLSIIKSGKLRAALQAGDDLVTEVLARAAGFLGRACLSLRHILDPETIVLGGGLIEACDFFLVPIVEEIVASDPLATPGEGGRIAVAALGDDAVALGAVALAQRKAGFEPFAGADEQRDAFPEVTVVEPGTVTVGDQEWTEDVYVRVDGKPRRREKVLKKIDGDSDEVTAEELKKVCRGGPHTLFIGTGHACRAELTPDAQRFLAWRKVRAEVTTTPEAGKGWNRAVGRKALLLHIEC